MDSKAWGRMTGAEGVADSLRRAGVSRVFGIPSTENSDLYEALRNSAVDVAVATHEQCAAFMAGAHARVTSSLGTCLLAPGASLINALSGIAEARFESWPVLVLVAGSSPPDPAGSPYASQRLDHLALVAPVCKVAWRIEEPEQIPLVVSAAVRTAQSDEPGPVLVEIPRSVQRRKAVMEGTGFRLGPRVLEARAEEGLQQAVEMIRNARAVGIYAGAGCFSALEEVATLAERLEAPVASTVSGLGVLPYMHPISVGLGPGATGTPLAERALGGCDLVLAVGCKFSEATVTGCRIAQPERLVHIDIEPTVAERKPGATVAITAPAKLALRFLLDQVEEKRNPGLRELIREGKRELRQRLAARPEWPDAVDPVKFFLQLRELLSGEDVLVLDSGQHAFYGIAVYQVQAPRTLIMPVDFRALGFAVPAAVAVKLASPDTRVVACVGDGGFQLTGFELLTARRCNVSPVVVVFTDGRLGFARSQQKRMIDRGTSADLVPVNYEELARALGVGYVRILRDRELGDGLKKALLIEAPVIVELRVAYREAARYLDAVSRADWQRLPRSTAMKLGARLILRQILNKA